MPPPPEAAQVLRQFRIVFNAVKTHFQQVERKVGIGGSQVWALSLVAGHPGMGVGALAQAMDIHQSTASNLVKALTQRGLLGTDRDDRDRRAVRLHLTPEGHAVLDQAPAPWAGVLPDALAQLDGDTLRRLDHDLAQLIQMLAPESAHDAAKTPLADM